MTKASCVVQLSGSIRYNGEKLNQFFPQRTAAYVNQVCFLSSAQHPLHDLLRMLCKQTGRHTATEAALITWQLPCHSITCASVSALVQGMPLPQLRRRVVLSQHHILHTCCGAPGEDCAERQVDSHLAELTVKETMDFSARVQGPGTKRGKFHSQHSQKPAVFMCPQMRFLA